MEVGLEDDDLRNFRGVPELNLEDNNHGFRV